MIRDCSNFRGLNNNYIRVAVKTRKENQRLVHALERTMKSLMIQGTSSGAGKSTLVTALCRIFANKGFSVAPFKSQNMSNYSYKGNGFEISRAQAIQALGARCEITPDLNPIMLKPLGDYYSHVYLKGKKFKKMHATEYYQKFVRTQGLKLL